MRTWLETFSVYMYIAILFSVPHSCNSAKHIMTNLTFMYVDTTCYTCTFILVLSLSLYLCWCAGEVAKLQQHLDLLREQYVKLQQKQAELEQRYTTAVVTSGNVGTDHFVSRLLKLVSDLFDKPLYRYCSLCVCVCVCVFVCCV